MYDHGGDLQVGIRLHWRRTSDRGRVQKRVHCKQRVLRTPTDKRPRAVGTRYRAVTCNSLVLKAFRYVVHRFFGMNEIPTIKKIHAALIEELEEDENVKESSCFTVYRLLDDIDFEPHWHIMAW